MPYEKFTKLGLTEEKLAALYLTHTDVQIAEAYGVAEITVRRWRKKAGVDRLTARKRADQGRVGPTLEELTEPRLRELHQMHTDEEIGALYGVSKFPIRDLRHRYGIEAIRHGPRPQPAVVVSSLSEARPVKVPPKAVPLPSAVPDLPAPQSPNERRAREAERARARRAEARVANPVKTLRTFVCKVCGKPWETEQHGNFRTCPSCREEAKVAVRTKTCAYGACGKTFTDESPQNSMSYCKEECRRRAKMERSGGVPQHGFLADRTYICQNPACGKSFDPEVANQKYCSIECRSVVYTGGDEARVKVCVHCGEKFVDISGKNNQRAHPACSRKVWDHKQNPNRALDQSPRLAINRRDRVRLGDGGRLDDIATMAKFTHSWWGRVSELIFAAYRDEASDVNTTHGGRSPYDFHDPEFKRVDVRSAQERPSPQGRPMWVFQVDGLRESCDHAFLVGYTKDGERIAHLWLMPQGDLNDSVVRMAPGSSEYRGDRWDITPLWGVMIGNGVLAKVRAFPDPVKLEQRFSWVGDPENFTGPSPMHRGRRGEFLYQMRYPHALDMNTSEGVHAKYDFHDPDGVRVNVKTSRRHPRTDRPSVMKWSFGILAVEQVRTGHRCDVYSCLCLDDAGTTVLKEYRIPAAALGDRRLIHIYDQPGGQWEPYLETTRSN